MTRKEERRDAALEEYYPNAPETINDFILGAEWADQTMIDKVCKWLKENIDHYAYNKDFVTKEDFIKSFRKAMEE